MVDQQYPKKQTPLHLPYFVMVDKSSKPPITYT